MDRRQILKAGLGLAARSVAPAMPFNLIVSQAAASATTTPVAAAVMTMLPLETTLGSRLSYLFHAVLDFSNPIHPDWDTRSCGLDTFWANRLDFLMMIYTDFQDGHINAYFHDQDWQKRRAAYEEQTGDNKRYDEETNRRIREKFDTPDKLLQEIINTLQGILDINDAGKNDVVFRTSGGPKTVGFLNAILQQRAFCKGVYGHWYGREDALSDKMKIEILLDSSSPHRGHPHVGQGSYLGWFDHALTHYDQLERKFCSGPGPFMTYKDELRMQGSDSQHLDQRGQDLRDAIDQFFIKREGPVSKPAAVMRGTAALQSAAEKISPQVSSAALNTVAEEGSKVVKALIEKLSAMGRMFGKATAPAVPDVEKAVPQIAYNPSPTLDEMIVPATDGIREEAVVLRGMKPELNQ